MLHGPKQPPLPHSTNWTLGQKTLPYEYWRKHRVWKKWRESDVTQHRNKHRSRGFLDQWLTKKRVPLMTLLEQSSVSFALVVLDWGVLSILSCDPTFKQQAVMAISAKSVDKALSWLTDNGIADDTTEYACKFYGKWISTKVNCLGALFSRMSLLIKPRSAHQPLNCPCIQFLCNISCFQVLHLRKFISEIGRFAFMYVGCKLMYDHVVINGIW